MQESDIVMMERELGIKLPESYKLAVVPFRLKALAGNTEYELWDDATKLIALNKKLRVGDRWQPAWPPHMFAVGDPHGDEMIALDTRSADGPVWWLDHGLVNSKASFQSHAKFADWVEEFYRDLRSDFEGDGLNPDGTPADLKRKQHPSLDLVSLLVLAVGVAVIIKGFFWLIAWMKHK